MRAVALLLLLPLSLAACKQADPQRTQAYEDLTGRRHVVDDAVAPADSALTTSGKPYSAEILAEYDAAGQVPQPNLNMQAMRGMPLPDTATRGWASVGRSHRQHAAGEHPAPPKAGSDPARAADPSGISTEHTRTGSDPSGAGSGQ